MSGAVAHRCSGSVQNGFEIVYRWLDPSFARTAAGTGQSPVTTRSGGQRAEQIDTAVTGGRFNDLNQLANTINGGRVRIAGHLTNKPGTVVVGTNAAVMDREHRSFVAYAGAVLTVNESWNWAYPSSTTQQNQPPSRVTSP